MQWNASPLISNKHSQSVNVLKPEKNNIALISETRLKTKLAMVTGYDVIRSDRPNEKGGVAVLERSRLKYQVLNFGGFKMKPEICGIKVNINNETYNLISIYRPPTLFMNSRGWSIKYIV